ncbi:MAG: class II aldolase/adducin family protein [Pseudomonadota bacterium]
MTDASSANDQDNNADPEIEGTIHFAYELSPPENAAASPQTFAQLSAWRSVLHALQLLGQQPDRYQGYAYGNLSCRSVEENPEQFVITASQTSGHPNLLDEHLVRITHYNLSRFWIEAQGHEPPSSESITHAMIYAADPRISWVFHVHSSEIWQQRDALVLPATPADVAYGSAAMATAVSELLQTHQSRPLVCATAGHEDGIFALAHNSRDCGGLLVSYLAKARTLLAAQ